MKVKSITNKELFTVALSLILPKNSLLQLAIFNSKLDIEYFQLKETLNSLPREFDEEKKALLHNDAFIRILEERKIGCVTQPGKEF